MSIKAMTHVWATSKQKGSALVLLLAIADYAHDDGGGAYPSVETLAAKCRMTDRNVQLLIRSLCDAGELCVEVGTGPHRSNMYRLPMGEKFSPLKSFQGENAGTARVKNSVPEGEKLGTARVKASSPNPSGNRHRTVTEPSYAKPARIAEPEPLAEATPPPVRSLSPVEKEKAERTPPGASTERFGFDHWFAATFWPAYPNKADKARALKSLKPFVTTDARAAEVMAGLGRYMRSEKWARDGGKYVESGGVWCLNRRWEDEPPPAGTPGVTRPPTPAEAERKQDQDRASDARVVSAAESAKVELRAAGVPETAWRHLGVEVRAALGSRGATADPREVARAMIERYRSAPPNAVPISPSPALNRLREALHQ